MVQPVYMLNGSGRPINKRRLGCSCGSIGMLLVIILVICLVLAVL
jgi:hypothetical protein